MNVERPGGQLEPIVGRNTPWSWGWNGDVCAVWGVAIVVVGDGNSKAADRKAREEHARLLSAAPELLEALQELRYACTDKAERMADAAIAKALGVPPNA